MRLNYLDSKSKQSSDGKNPPKKSGSQDGRWQDERGKGCYVRELVDGQIGFQIRQVLRHERKPTYRYSTSEGGGNHEDCNIIFKAYAHNNQPGRTGQ